jgi:ABC-type multidrug transport system fused ATPase/permease subunit
MEKEQSVVKRTLFSWVSSSSLKLQVALIFIAILMVVVRVFPLEMQKRIVNEAIILKKFDLLLSYCLAYLLAVVAASGLKYLSVIIQTQIGQQAMADMRKKLYSHIISLPLDFFRKTQPGLVVNSLVSELNVPSNFVGMAIAVPVINILTLLAFAGYLFYLNPLLAIISFSIYPVIIFLVPILQKRANFANKKRVDLSRKLSGRIAESISGIHEIHGSGAYRLENQKFSSLVKKLMKVRVIWSRYREGIKVTNNFFTSLGPLIIFILGGYLAINGRLDLGALVAFLSAQEKLYTPWKELIEFYQVYQNATVTYNRTMKYFDADIEYDLEPVERTPYALTGSLEVKNLSFVTEDSIQLLTDINFTLKPGEHLALVGFSGSGKSTVAKCIAQLCKYSDGQVILDNKEISTLTKLDVVRNIGFIPQEPFMFEGTIEENLLYSCDAIHGDANKDSEVCKPGLDDMVRLLQQTGAFIDILRFGLSSIISSDQNQDLADRIIKVRKKFQSIFEEDLEGYIEFFKDDKYLYHLSIAENLIFGTPRQKSYVERNLLNNKIFIDFLNKADLTRPLLKLGTQLSEQTIDILGNLTPTPTLFEKSPIAFEELDTFKELSRRLKTTKLHQLTKEDKDRLLALALRFTPGQHKMVALSKMLENLILEGRALFKDTVATREPEKFICYNEAEYIFSQPILNNIFFGKITSSALHVQEKINKCIVQLLIEEDLLDLIIENGLKYEVGSKGENLSGGQKQKLAIARALLKNPKILIMDEATSALDNRSQARIQNLLETRLKGKTTLISVIHRLDIIKNYDKIAVMKAGKIVEFGPYEQLISRQGVLYELVSGKK